MKTRKALMTIVDAASPASEDHHTYIHRQLAHVMLGAYELAEATSDADKAGILRCIINRANNALVHLDLPAPRRCGHGFSLTSSCQRCGRQIRDEAQA